MGQIPFPRRVRGEEVKRWPKSFSASVVNCSMLSPRLVVEENCQLSTSATWSHVPIGGLVKKFTFYWKWHVYPFRWEGGAWWAALGTVTAPRHREVSGKMGAQLTLGLFVSMLYHRMDAQALGIWQMLEITTTGKEWVCGGSGEWAGRQKALVVSQTSSRISSISRRVWNKGQAVVEHTRFQPSGRSGAESAQQPERKECRTWRLSEHHQELVKLTCSRWTHSPRIPHLKHLQGILHEIEAVPAH